MEKAIGSIISIFVGSHQAKYLRKQNEIEVGALLEKELLQKRKSDMFLSLISQFSVLIVVLVITKRK